MTASSDSSESLQITTARPLDGRVNGKNIVLRADGTVNLGGDTPASNVYQRYKAIDLHDWTNPQITFYDNGVGTSKNKYWRAVSGAVGFGFWQNVIDMYEFLAREYEPGDKVFIFGFSRGAATVRAFNGLVAASGLIKGRTISDDDLHAQSEAAMTAYRDPNNQAKLAEPTEVSHGAIPIECLAVWDTVSALGFPQNWVVKGVGTLLLNWLSMAADRVADLVWPHRFYNYALTSNVRSAYQALAIDDERNSFEPLVWDESLSLDTEVEQVWFAGAHSNVGGGYGRMGLSNLALDWMMRRAAKHGLTFRDRVHDDVVAEAHAGGRLYNSRDGMGVYYRYRPRSLKGLSANKLRGPVRIHDSVFTRMEHKVGNYAPGNLPFEFDIVSSDPDADPKTSSAAEDAATWASHEKAVGKYVSRREWLYGLFLEATLFIVGAGIWFWVNPPAPHVAGSTTLDWWTGHIANLLSYVTPTMFDGLITVAVLDSPIYAAGTLAFFIVARVLWKSWTHKTVLASESARATLVASVAE